MRIKNRLAAVAVGTAATLVLGAGAASAWTTSPANTGFSGTSSDTVLTNQAGTVTLSCTTSSAGGTTKGTNDNPVAEITSLSFGGTCVTSTGWGFTATSNSASFPWPLTGSSYSGGVTTGSLSGVDVTIVGPGCNARVTGSVAGSYTNPTGGGAGNLTVSTPAGALTIVSGNNCLGQLPVGSNPSFSSVNGYNIPTGPTVTNP